MRDLICDAFEILYPYTDTKIVRGLALTRALGNSFLKIYRRGIQMKISPGKHLRKSGIALLVIKGLIGRLASVFTITEQELMDAGVYLERMDY